MLEDLIYRRLHSQLRGSLLLAVFSVAAVGPRLAAQDVRFLSFADFSNHVARQLLPTDFTLSTGSKLTVIDIVYCSAIDPNKGRLLAVSIPQPPSLIGGQHLLTSADCSAKGDIVAARALNQLGSVDWVAVLTLIADWSKWQLNLFAKDAIIQSRSASTGPTSTALITQLGNPLATLVLSDLQINDDKGSLLKANMALSFSGGTVNAVLLPTPVMASFNMSSALANISFAPSVVPPESTVILAVSQKFLKDIVASRLGSDKIPIQTNIGTFNLTNTTIQGSENDILLSGTVENSGSTFDVTTTWTGDDLTLATVSASARHQSCQNMSTLSALRCNVFNTGRDQAALAFKNIVIQLYVGKLKFRPVGLRTVTTVNVNGKKYGLRTQVNKAHSSAQDFVLFGTVGLEAK